MLSKIISGATIGLDSVVVEVEVDIPDQGFPGFNIVGLPGKAIKEAIERVRSAIKNSGCKFPNKRITVNLTPADLPKEGPAYDLPIALGILAADGQIPKDISKYLVFGELSLDGSLRHTNGALPLTLLAKQKKIEAVLLPAVNAKEASMISGVKIIPINSLSDLIQHLSGNKIITPIPFHKVSNINIEKYNYPFDMEDIRGQQQAKRVLEIAAAGGHNLFMIGSPGSGKTMLSRTLPTILPEMTEDEMLEVTKIYSIAGKLNNQHAITTRPFRSPHHTTSMSGLIGGGSKPRPGEISLAHRGVLFLDEFLEFPRSILESLRQPIEDGIVTISRVAGTLQFPARFLLTAAANPCPCGYLLSKKRECTCMTSSIERYQKRLSGPILDRIDLHISVPEVEIDKLTQDHKTESSYTIRKRVNKARKMQISRYKSNKMKIFCNADMNTKQVKKICILDANTSNFLKKAASKHNLSARSYFKILKVSRTIADLEESPNIQIKHVAESLQYRPKLKES